MKRRKGRIYEGQYYKTIMHCVIYIFLCALLFACLPDNMIREIISIASIPISTALFTYAIGQIQNSSNAFLDMRIFENCRCLDSNLVIWHTEEAVSDNIVMEIYNNGDCIISATDIIINPTTPKKDKIYNISYPLKPGESLYAVLPLKVDNIEKVYLQYYSNRVDKALSFEGSLTIQERAVYKNKKYMFERISPVKNYSISKVKKQFVMNRQIVNTFRRPSPPANGWQRQ